MTELQKKAPHDRQNVKSTNSLVLDFIIEATSLNTCGDESPFMREIRKFMLRHRQIFSSHSPFTCIFTNSSTVDCINSTLLLNHSPTYCNSQSIDVPRDDTSDHIAISTAAKKGNEEKSNEDIIKYKVKDLLQNKNNLKRDKKKLTSFLVLDDEKIEKIIKKGKIDIIIFLQEELTKNKERLLNTIEKMCEGHESYTCIDKNKVLCLKNIFDADVALKELKNFHGYSALSEEGSRGINKMECSEKSVNSDILFLNPVSPKKSPLVKVITDTDAEKTHYLFIKNKNKREKTFHGSPHFSASKETFSHQKDSLSQFKSPSSDYSNWTNSSEPLRSFQNDCEVLCSSSVPNFPPVVPTFFPIRTNYCSGILKKGEIIESPYSKNKHVTIVEKTHNSYTLRSKF